MLKWIETSGKNEDAAIGIALQKLGLDRDEVSVEVLERARSGFLGIGAAPARIKVSYEVPDEPAPVVPPAAAPSPAKKAEPPKKTAPPAAAPRVQREKAIPTAKMAEPPLAPKPAAAKQTREAAPAKAAAPAKTVVPAKTAAPAVQDEELESKIASFLTGLLTHMGLSAEVKSSPRAEGGYQVLLEGEHLGALIGHRGETLDAVSQLCNYAVNRDRKTRVRIHIDVENYRQKREESLRRLAEKVAAKVVKYRRNITLEPMNAYERHVIHETLQEVPDVLTYSTGTEPNRRTVVAYSRGKHKE